MDIHDQTVLERAIAPPEIGISGEEIVLLDIHGGHYLTLAGTVSVRIWQMLDKPRSAASMVDSLVAEFDVDPDRCREETKQFLSELIARGLLRPRE